MTTQNDVSIKMQGDGYLQKAEGNRHVGVSERGQHQAIRPIEGIQRDSEHSTKIISMINMHKNEQRADVWVASTTIARGSDC